MTKRKPHPSQSRTPNRRGMAVAVIVVVLAVLALAVAGSVRPVRQEADIASLRVQTLRAFYATESGANVLIGSLQAGIDPPASGDSLTWGHQTVEFETVPVGTGTVTILGRSGQSQRRISLDIE